jgi:outer membrane protein
LTICLLIPHSKMVYSKVLLAVVGFFISYGAFTQGQDSIVGYRKLTLSEVIEIAKQSSLSFHQAKIQKEKNDWNWKTIQANYKPMLSLSGTLPDYGKTNATVVQPDGTIRFVSISQAYSNLNLGVSQNIGLTGTSISAYSQINRFDNLNSSSMGHSYSSNPFLFSLNQPLFQYNSLKWIKKIEILKYEESQKQYLEDIESIAADACELFFNLLESQIKLEIAQNNKLNNDTIYKIALNRSAHGSISQDELLQLEYELLTARQNEAKAYLDVETNALKLRTFIGYRENLRIILDQPSNIPYYDVNEEFAVKEAQKNRSIIVANRRLLLEAQSEVAKAKGTNSLNMDIQATYGLTSKGSTIQNTYLNPADQQTLQVTFAIPIINWGQSEARTKTAQAFMEYQKTVITQNEINFNQEIYTLVRKLGMLRLQIATTKKCNEIAHKRYLISKRQYLEGRIAILNLSNSASQKDQAVNNYTESLKNFWTVHYNLRKLTLFDFELNHPIEY